jgi:DNA-binding transcriptional LysR family regulator
MLLDDRELDLAMREADVAIRLRRPTQPDLIQRKLFTVHYHAYASPEYLRRRGTPKALDDLENHSILAFGVSPPYLSDVNLLETAGRREGSPRRSVLRVNNVYGLYKAVEAHLGIATLPDYLVERESGLVQVDLPLEAPAFDTYFVYPEELKESKRVAVFRDFIVSKAKEWKY